MAIIEEVVEGEEELNQNIENIKKAGNDLFGRGEYEKAVEKYQQGIDLCSANQDALKAILFSNLSAAFIKLNKWPEAVEAATKSIELGIGNEKALERRAFAYSNISEKFEMAIEDYKSLQTTCEKRKAEFDRKIDELTKKITERNEKLKDEVIQKLKGFGDFCLKPFGLSTNSFELKDNGQGGYSVQMKNQDNSNQANEKEEVQPTA